MGECRKANPVLDKALDVLGQAELFEPVRDLLHGRHQRSRRSMTEFSTAATESLYQYGRDSTPLTATFGVASCRFQSSLGISISAFDGTAKSKSMLSAFKAYALLAPKPGVAPPARTTRHGALLLSMQNSMRIMNEKSISVIVPEAAVSAMTACT